MHVTPGSARDGRQGEKLSDTTELPSCLLSYFKPQNNHPAASHQSCCCDSQEGESQSMRGDVNEKSTGLNLTVQKRAQVITLNQQKMLFNLENIILTFNNLIYHNVSFILALYLLYIINKRQFS